MNAAVENRQAGQPTVGEAVRSEPWSFVLLGLAAGVVAGILFKSPMFRRAFRVYRKFPK